MELDELRGRGRSQAEQWLLAGQRRASRYAGQIKTDCRAIGGICRRLTPLRGDRGGTALEWLLDNRYLAQHAAHEAVRAVRKCPSLTVLRLEQERFRIQQIGYLLSELEHFDEDSIQAFLSGIQEVQPLKEEELALIPHALAAGLAARFRSYAEQVEQLLREGSDPSGLSEDLRQLVERLAKLSRLQFGSMLEELSAVDRLFQQDPAGVYPKMDAYSRHAYRTRLCKLAQKHKMSQTACAQQVLELARDGGAGSHIGTYLFPRPLGWQAKGDRSGWYVAGVTLPTTVISIAIGFALARWWAILLFLLPVSELMKNTVDLVLLHVVKPRPVFRMELKNGVPPEGKTLCVIAALLTGEDSAAQLTGKLERYALANRRAGDQVCYGLLADLPDRKRQMNEQDQALVSKTAADVEALNRKYGSRFYLFFRQPVYAPSDDTYRGRERKRGAIVQLVRFLRGRRGEVEVRSGQPEGLRGTRFLLVLDSDTILTMDAVNELAGTMLHPLNTPQVDPKRKIVTQGYGILQPRVETELSAADRSTFARLFSGIGGLDPYGGAVSDLYHDLFDQATFMGKGLIHIDAFLACMDGRFPENRILSHDLLEGSYLRCGWVSRTELMDSFPSNAVSWLSRYHRWIRGDWQILSWLGRRVPNEAGQRERNPIPPLAKWKIFDNLRRSLVPPATAAALLAGLLGTGPLFLSALLAALLTVLSQMVTAAAEFACQKGKGSFRRYHSGIYSGFSGSALRSGADLLFLPIQSLTALSAVYLALWRMLAGHKHLLDWVTSGQSSQGKKGLAAYYKRFWPSVALGFAAMACSAHWAGRILGLAWAVSPLLFFKWGRPKQRETGLPQRERAFLLHEAALIWRYYEHWLKPEFHYLIPDNVQSMPDQGAAPRTSPTNLGLALLSCLAAIDLNLAPKKQALKLIEQQLDALEGLERWHGHFYNWYDIRTCKLLHPRYVSTVDSGNLCADLITLKQGLEELGEQALAERARRLAEEMDFSMLFDARQQLFYIGYDVEQGKYSGGHYDLMASEARTTSYLAIARGEVPPRHWRALSRAIVRRNRYIGMVSWSGTMFEYLMPQLLLPVYPDSVWGETLSFCVDQQRREGNRTALPWGISESGYYALDLRQNFQYKAHGVPALTLRNEPTAERVIAPYASYLALLVQPRAAAANLRRLRSMGTEGVYGLYEALDFTASRGGSRKSPLMVRSWMAHHLGMSLLALDNCLNDSPMVRRFMADAQMASAQELLQEKIPVGDAVMKPAPTLRIPQPRARRAAPWQRTGSGWDREDPVWGIVANEGYSVLLSPSGAGSSRVGRCTLLHPEGIQIVLRQGDTATQIFPLSGGDSRLRWVYRSGQAALIWEEAGFALAESVTVDAVHKGERRTVTVQAKERMEATLCILARPVLSEWEAYAAHPAFSRMCVESRFIGGGVRFVRRPGRGSAVPVLTALWSEQDAGWTTNREQYLTEGSISHTGREGTVLDPCLALELPLKLEKGQRKSLTLAFAAGGEQDSLRSAQALLGLRKPVGAPLLDQLGAALGQESINSAMVLLSRLLSPGALGSEGEVLGQQSLWRFAISGDLPIVTLRVQQQEQSQALQLSAIHRCLSRMGIAFDLVLLLPEQGDYFQTIRNGLTRQLERLGWGDAIGANGGIHLISGTEEDWKPMIGMAALNLRPEDALQQPNRFDTPVQPQRELRTKRPPIQWQWKENSFVMETGGSLPPVRWSHLLVNSCFGWRCDEAGTGHLWYGNAQLGQLTGWQNDPIALTGPEQLLYRWDEGDCALFAARDGYPTAVTYGPGYARWEKTFAGRKVTLTAFVPRDQAVRVWKLQLHGAKLTDRIVWRFQPRLSQQQRHAPWVKWHRDGNTITLQNPAGTMLGTTLELKASQLFESAEYRHGQITAAFLPAQELLLTAGVAGAYRLDARSSFDRMDEALTHTVQWWTSRTTALQVRTPDEGLNHYLSFWGLYQVLSGRVLGRNGLYQCGGAIGFRDQLQDVLALMPFAPELVRSQIHQAASHQFREGDVLHWWHPTAETDVALGVRTRISDDLLWLPYTLCRWMEEIGDRDLLLEQAPYLEGSPLKEREAERYDRWQYSVGGESIYRHGVQAIECVLNRGIGAHGLCLMGTGDWNDGMNRMGAKGRGESVWLSWFLALVLRRFAPVCQAMGEAERARRYEKLFPQMTGAAQAAWDGEWYLRAYDDEGRAVGSRRNGECAIDSVSQSFAVFAPSGEAKQNRQALRAAYEKLYDREHQLVRLLWPPFHGDSDPGYIRAYPDGLRENGGQYTHAACWLAMALLRSGETDKAWELLYDLLPEHHPWQQYRAEPYVLAGDVYDAQGQQGRGGWSWYTGAAGWYCQTVTRYLLGLRLEQGALTITPNLPELWQGYEADWKGAQYDLHIQVLRGDAAGTTLDGALWQGKIPLSTLRGHHEVKVMIPYVKK